MKENKFTIRLTAKNKETKKVPLKTLVKTFEALQKIMYDIAGSTMKKEPISRGRIPTEIEKVSELYLLKAEPGSITATIAFPQRTEDLVPEIPDVVDLVANNFKNIFDGIIHSDYNAIRKTVQNSIYRRKILYTINEILPDKNSDYEMYFNFQNEGPNKIKKIDEDGIKEIIGEVVEETTVPVEGEIEAQLHCRVIIDEKGDIKSIKEVLELEMIEGGWPIKFQSIDWNGEVIIMKKEILCEIKRDGEYYLIEYEPLGIIAYAKTREGVVDEFKEEFSMIYHYYGLESDSNLTQDAIELKRKINDLVGTVQFKLGG